MRDLDNTYSRVLVEWRLQCTETEKAFVEETGQVRGVRKQVRREGQENKGSPQTLRRVIQHDQPVCVLVLT